MMKLIEEHQQDIQEILDALKYCDFDDLEDCDYIFEEKITEKFQLHYSKPFEYSNGATKGVLIFKNLGFVIKIPFTWCGGDEICGASDGAHSWDYCSQEVCRYEMAEDNGIAEVFLQTEYLGDVNDYPIYIQPYAEIFKNMAPDAISEHCYESSEEQKEQTRSLNSQYAFDDIQNIWESEVLALYGKDFYIKLKTYISDYDINDLRTANIGYYQNKPVLVDYAGFYE